MDKWISRYEFLAQSVGTVEYTNCTSAEGLDPPPPPNACPGYDTKQSDGDTKHPFIAIAPWSTLARRGSAW